MFFFSVRSEVFINFTPRPAFRFPHPSSPHLEPALMPQPEEVPGCWQTWESRLDLEQSRKQIGDFVSFLRLEKKKEGVATG